jgi:hypothetical protein
VRECADQTGVSDANVVAAYKLSLQQRSLSEAHDLRRRYRLAAIAVPVCHQLASPLVQITAPVSSLNRVADGMRQRHLDDVVRLGGQAQSFV